MHQRSCVAPVTNNTNLWVNKHEKEEEEEEEDEEAAVGIYTSLLPDISPWFFFCEPNGENQGHEPEDRPLQRLPGHIFTWSAGEGPYIRTSSSLSGTAATAGSVPRLPGGPGLSWEQKQERLLHGLLVWGQLPEDQSHALVGLGEPQGTSMAAVLLPNKELHSKTRIKAR
ncbi:hypothetical protein M0R45_028173 [Rubus argutus]|uniref:Uncharacterized protein n=1 Tax=Rubus argutus TaxID=59490 RepID=A0AAW1W6I4_RUBAR